MNNATQISVLYLGRELEVPAEIEYYSSKERLQKGLKAFGICWLVGAICVAVPVLHFVLTPMAILMGPIAGFLVYARVKKLPKRVEGDVSCGQCHALTHFRFVDAKPPLFEACQHCKTGYEVLWPPKTQA